MKGEGSTSGVENLPLPLASHLTSRQMLYLASAQPPTAQLGAIKCNFYEAETSVVVIKFVDFLHFPPSEPRELSLLSPTASSTGWRLTVYKKMGDSN